MAFLNQYMTPTMSPYGQIAPMASAAPNMQPIMTAMQGAPRGGVMGGPGMIGPAPQPQAQPSLVSQLTGGGSGAGAAGGGGLLPQMLAIAKQQQQGQQPNPFQGGTFGSGANSTWDPNAMGVGDIQKQLQGWNQAQSPGMFGNVGNWLSGLFQGGTPGGAIS